MLAEMGIPWPLQLIPATSPKAPPVWIAAVVSPLTAQEDRLLANVLSAIEVAFVTTAARWVIAPGERDPSKPPAGWPTDSANSVLVLFGRDAARLVLGTDVDAGTVVTTHGRAVVTHGLSALLAEPIKKRDLWHHLCSASSRTA
jgi:hypothetical protein